MKKSTHTRRSFIHFPSRMGIWALPVLALALGGCLSRAPIHEQTFAFGAPVVNATNAPAGARLVRIKSLQIDPMFDSRSLVYRTGEFSYTRDPYAEFLGSPADVLLTPITELLRSDGCFSAVVNAGSAARPDTLAEINVSQLYGDLRKSGSPNAALAIQITFLDATNGMAGKVIFQKYYSRTIPMESATPAALMKAWNRALTEIFDEMASDFRAREN